MQIKEKLDENNSFCYITVGYSQKWYVRLYDTYVLNLMYNL